MPFIVKTRRLEGPAQEAIQASFAAGARAAADLLALEINCKPFTPFFAWVEEVAAVATGLAYSQIPRNWTERAVYVGRDRQDVENWVRFNRDWMRDLTIDGEWAR